MDESTPVNVVEVLRILRKRAWLIIGCVVVAGAITFVVARHEQKQYTAQATLLFRSTELDQETAGLPTSGPANPQGEVDTALKLATLGRVARTAASAVGGDLTPA